MRPRVFPAEDAVLRPPECGLPEASMRPRVFPAEDTSTAMPVHGVAARFNEAAGIPRGRHNLAARRNLAARPRFNEAAGIPRGRLVVDVDRPVADVGLQ